MENNRYATQASVEGKTKERMGRLKQIGMQGEEDFRSKYAHQTIQVNSKGYTKIGDLSH